LNSNKVKSDIKRMGPRERRGGAMDPATYHAQHKMQPVSFELFRSSVVFFFFSSSYLSNSSLSPSPFQTSYREPSHSSSLVHRSLAKSTDPDWSPSKRGRISGPFDPLLSCLGQGENSTDISLPLMHPFSHIQP